MSEISIDTRPIGVEDLLLDSSGADTASSFTDQDGVSHPLTGLNAGHIYLKGDTRPQVGQAATVDEAIANLAEDIQDVAQQQTTAMTEDTVIDLSSSSGRQTLIDAQLKNLGGHTLTFRFPAGVSVQVVTSPLVFSGFYNGTLIADLNGGSISDNGTLDNEGVLRFVNCKCAVKVVKNVQNPTTGDGIISYTSNRYGVALIHVPDCEFENIAFSGANINTDYAVFSFVSNACFNNCSFSSTKKTLSNSIYKDYTDEHNVSTAAHSDLFSSKADKDHTHAIADVTSLSSALNSLDTGKAPAVHSHAITDVNDLQDTLSGKAASDHAHNIGGTGFSEIGFSNVKSAIEKIGFLFAGGQVLSNLTQFEEYPVGYEDASGKRNRGWLILPLYLADPNGADNLVPIVVEWGVTSTIAGGGDKTVTQNIPVPVRQVFYVGFTSDNSSKDSTYSQVPQFIKMTSQTSFQFYNQNVGQYSVNSRHYWFLIGVYGGEFSSLPFSYSNPNT